LASLLLSWLDAECAHSCIERWVFMGKILCSNTTLSYDCSIYKEIGAGERIALSKLAVVKFEETGRPLRIAVDTSIWLFQIQSGKGMSLAAMMDHVDDIGGSNPALRTFYYRLLRLMSLCIHPVFVFDGPNKPPVKRNKRTAGPNVNVSSIPEFLAKQLLKQFGFPMHMAPGEAEAECALLQREGVVDMVMTEDVDALMFGTGMLLRNWTNESKGKTPTHVNLFDATKIKASSKLDREGMILVALMSGGDYVPQGIPGCGPKLACEAARAGFGADLCKIRRGDKAAYKEWRERLQHELNTNEGKLFKSKHSAVKLPEDFPDPEVLGYYTNPAISKRERVLELKDSIVWDNPLDFPALRKFAAEAFDWRNFSGAKKFIRNLAPALLVRDLCCGAANQKPGMIKGIHHQPRNHTSTDGVTELRVSYVANDIVDIDLSSEPPDDEIAAGYADEEDAELDPEDQPSTAVEGGKRAPYLYDPTKTEKIWLMEAFVKVGAQDAYEEWQQKVASNAAAAAAKLAKAQEKQQRNNSNKVTQPDPAGAVQAGEPRQVQKLTKTSATLSTDSVSASQPVGNGGMASQTETRGARKGKGRAIQQTISSSQPVPTRVDSIDLSKDDPVSWDWPASLSQSRETRNGDAVKRARSPRKPPTSTVVSQVSPTATPKPKRTRRQNPASPLTDVYTDRDVFASPSRHQITSYFSPTPSPSKDRAPVATLENRIQSIDMTFSPSDIGSRAAINQPFNDIQATREPELDSVTLSPSYSPSPESRRIRAQRKQKQSVVDLTLSSPIRLPLRPSVGASNRQPPTFSMKRDSCPPSPSPKRPTPARPPTVHTFIRVRTAESGVFVYSESEKTGEMTWRVDDVKVLDLTRS
jgi:holliday junction resolvase YEN1